MRKTLGIPRGYAPLKFESVRVSIAVGQKSCGGFFVIAIGKSTREDPVTLAVVFVGPFPHFETAFSKRNKTPFFTKCSK